MSYDPSLSTDKDKARFYSGDRIEAREQFSDAEIMGLLAIYNTPIHTAAAMCSSLAAQYSRLAMQVIGQLRVDATKVADSYAATAERLTNEANSSNVRAPLPRAPSISVSRKQANVDNTDVVQPFFTRDMDDFDTGRSPNDGEG